MSSNLESNGLISLKNNGLVALQNDSLDCDGLVVVVDDNCEFSFEGRSYLLDQVPCDDLAIPPLLPRRKSSCIARTVSEDYDKGIDLAGFIRSDVSFGTLRGLNETRLLYPPNSRMSDFRRQILIFVHNFVPTDDKSITPECFFTLGELGKPNQSSWIMLFHVLGICMCRYNPGQFIDVDVDAAVRSTVEQTIQTNRMFFGKVKNWCDMRTGDLISYNDLAQLTDPIGQIFHEMLCAKITADGGDYHVIFLGKHA